MSSAEQENLMRIRDNQRRSRARRKEYLRELEARLRQCALQGVETSAEIQLAARRVADENRKLRCLLEKHGVGDNVVNAYLTDEPLHARSSHGPDASVATDSRLVEGLEQMLNTRKPCCADGSGRKSKVLPATISVRENDRRVITSSANQSRLLSNTTSSTPTTSRNVLKTRCIAPDANSQTRLFQSTTPSSTMSQVTSMNIPHSHVVRIPSLQGQQYVRTMKSSTQAMSSSVSTMVPSVSHGRQKYEFNHEPPQAIDYQQNSPTDHDNRLAQARSHPMGHMWSTLGHHMAIATSDPEPDPGMHDMNNCMLATDMITTMMGGDPSIVREELGCGPNLDCNVSNQLVFNVMDRYAG
ncbi:MAG: hypothetical protein M1818_001146 [Claussenomyces sp. TS43310]|nr:MAG: hypothetical protein M1818_001146 [Claussenomyces sp. TS43310]